MLINILLTTVLNCTSYVYKTIAVSHVQLLKVVSPISEFDFPYTVICICIL